ncbi:hypothetical protein [Tahibacter harae]|uniref:Uncharacterized protein n=1 Tax=Tahibacter harae TaxID=2963937 RepID=A0ABT1QVH7_9GAMM|nr:hypothetical protein [Tahibacter harae]MCQ4166278.1 hypothetical protein [Tahibacter harae]
MSVQSRIARTALLSALAAALPAGAAEVCSPLRNLNVPATGEGLYLNLITGVSGEAESLAPGFDIDPYARQIGEPPGQLKFYWGSAANGGAGVVSSGTTFAVLQPGAVIGPDALFSRAGFDGDTSLWQAGLSQAYLGLRFKNEGSGAINYGWIRLSTQPPLGFPVTIHDWCYDDAGAPATVPAADAIYADGFELPG